MYTKFFSPFPLYLSVCSTLLEYGINIDCENEGWTALQLAALNGHVDIVSILLNKGAQSGGVNREGRTALDIARAEGQERIAAIILETEFQVRVITCKHTLVSAKQNLLSNLETIHFSDHQALYILNFCNLN